MFAIMISMEKPEATKGQFPVFRRHVDLELSPTVLHDLPLDASYVISDFMRELVNLRPQMQLGVQLSEEEKDLQKVGDCSLPIQLIFAAGRTCMSSRSRAVARFFNMTTLGFVDFSPHLDSNVMVKQLLEPGALSSQEASAAGGMQPLSEHDRDSLHYMVYVSHIINGFLWQRIAANEATGILTLAQTDLEKEEEILNVLWHRLAENPAASRDQQTGDVVCSGSLVTECLVSWGVVPLPVELLSRAICLACGVPSTAPESAQMNREVFMHFCQAHNLCGKDGGVLCRESVAIWAGLWALGCERMYEIQQMGVLFELFDTSRDGSLQFEEFEEYLKVVIPGLSHEDSEELFLCGAEEKDADMTKDAFLSLALRLGLSSDINTLDDLVNQKTDRLVSKKPVASLGGHRIFS